MAFWGIEVKPGKPHVYHSGDEKGRLHISQATLGDGSSSKKSILQCVVGDNKPIYLCSLLPEKLENCQLNLEFEEDDEVVFSIIGSHSVHLSGFFYEEDEDDHGHGCGSDHCDEGVMVTDSEDEDDSIYDSEDEDEDVDYSDDGFDYPPSPVPNSGVKIEEIVDEEKPSNGNGLSKRAKKKKTDNENSNRQVVAKARTVDPVIESEDDDGFPISANQKNSDISKDEKKSGEAIDEIKGDKSQKKNKKDDVLYGNNLKRKIDAVGQDETPAREDAIVPEKETKKKKNKSQKVAGKAESSQENVKPSSNVIEEPPVTESSQENVKPSSNVVEEPPVTEIGNDLKSSSEKKKEKKKNKKKNKQQESVSTPSAEEKQTDKNGPVQEKQESKEAKSTQMRTFSNGLAIEEVVMGKPDGKRATRGKKVSVHYIGKLKKNGKIFDSNIGKAPFEFRLGIGKVIKGWDVGVEGMRVGDKRRLTIPPSMAYGDQKTGPIPPNSWLQFDVELKNVH